MSEKSKDNNCILIGMYYDIESEEYIQLKNKCMKSRYQYVKDKQSSLLNRIYKLEKNQVNLSDNIPEKGKYLIVCDNYRQVLKLKKYFEKALKDKNINIDFNKDSSSSLVTKKTVFNNDISKFLASSDRDSLDLFFTFRLPDDIIYNKLSGVIIIRKNNMDFDHIDFLMNQLSSCPENPFLIADISLSCERFTKFKSQNLNNCIFYNQKLALNMYKCKNIKHTWYSVYSLVKEYIKTFKDLPDRNTIYKGYNIGNWINTQKQLMYNSKLDENKVKLLNDIDILESSRDALWYKNYRLIMEYKKIYKKLPTAREIYRDKKIGLWLTTQKTAYKKGKLSAYKIDLLSKAGVNFTSESLKWQRNYDLLIEFIKTYGRLPSKSTVYKHIPIGYWMFKQISHKDELSQISYDKLTDLTVFELNKNRGQTLLNKFKRENGSLPDKKTIYKGVALGLWCSSVGIIS